MNGRRINGYEADLWDDSKLPPAFRAVAIVPRRRPAALRALAFIAGLSLAAWALTLIMAAITAGEGMR